ncbi:MAG TPA: hypothetical protein VGE24_04175 [Emticicia sp.]
MSAQTIKISAPSVVAAYTSITIVKPSTTVLDTKLLFDRAHKEAALSPIDRFIVNTNDLNKILFKPDPLTWEESTFLLLGYISATEGYFRSLIRKIINIDEHSLRHVEKQDISYAAALHKNTEFLPEALMENHSFSSAFGIRSALKELLDIKNQYPSAIEALFEEYKKICQIRHCCVHRYGRLGSKNAIELGFSAHNDLIEKPIKLTSNDLAEISEILRTLIKSLNNHVFQRIMERTADVDHNNKGRYYSWTWSWVYSNDKTRFKLYYDIFSTKKDAIGSPKIKAIYDSFKKELSPTLKVTKKK